jgi:pyruvate dehydrogenase E1 component
MIGFSEGLSPETLKTLETIEQRVLWLATLMIHHANNVRPNADHTKVGGHQASSASVATILTALYFHLLQPGDRVSIKPHASPVFHAIQYLLGQLPAEYLTELRAYQGLQAYPSRTKDPDRVDFSTGSVGLGAVAPAFAALAHKYAQAHFGDVTSRRFIAVVGDAELDEGNVWEAILDEALGGLDNLLWIVDLNRQSLDRVVPGIRAARLKRLFADSGWQVLEAKYGRRLQALFALPGGEKLRQRIDEMSNQEYQAMVGLPGAEIRARLVEGHPEVSAVIDGVPDTELPAIIANLGGHDLAELISVLERANRAPGQPCVVFAYTIKGWGLPFAGNPLNHSMLLNAEQIERLRDAFGIQAGQEWDAFDPDSEAGALCRKIAASLYAPSASPQVPSPLIVPDQLPAISSDLATSTQDTFGRLLFRLADVPELKVRLVTSSPDVSVSTNLAGWINKTGAFSLAPETDYDVSAQRVLRWNRGPSGHHIELGISEMNLFLLLGMFGLSTELSGQFMIPIGTVYDPFVCRGLDALIYALYSGARFIFAGTPSGISLSPEGGAHQSTITPSIGAELPTLAMYEPCFAREVEWVLLEAIRQCFDREHGQATYIRLSTKPVDQHLLDAAISRLGEAQLRQQVLAGGYRLRDWRDGGPQIDPRYKVQIAASGTMLPEACAAAEALWQEGVAANVLNLTSPRRLYETWRAGRQTSGRAALFDWLIRPDEQQAPVVTVLDGASHALAWLGSVFGALTYPLGVDQFGQSGARAELYKYYSIDSTAIVAAAFEALDASETRASAMNRFIAHR